MLSNVSEAPSPASGGGLGWGLVNHLIEEL